ncbi:MAG: DNA-binding domain-containing protein [Burkholderiaceae bacterium]
MSMQEEFAGAVLDPACRIPAGLDTWNGSDPVLRFAVYRNNVVASLVSALSDTFPVTLELVGQEFFRAMARVFVMDTPPRDAVLTYYGEAFPDFIARFAPAAPVAYLADVARLEMLRVHAYHAHDALPVEAGALAALLANPEALPGVVLDLHPSVRVMRSSYAIVSVWAAHQGAADIASVQPDIAENALIARPDLDVVVRRIDPGTVDFIGQLLMGANLGIAATRASRNHPDFDVSLPLMQLIEGQLIANIALASRTLA